jgi:hypothetical protein
MLPSTRRMSIGRQDNPSAFENELRAEDQIRRQRTASREELEARRRAIALKHSQTANQSPRPAKPAPWGIAHPPTRMAHQAAGVIPLPYALDANTRLGSPILGVPLQGAPLRPTLRFSGNKQAAGVKRGFSEFSADNMPQSVRPAHNAPANPIRPTTQAPQTQQRSRGLSAFGRRILNANNRQPLQSAVLDGRC